MNTSTATAAKRARDDETPEVCGDTAAAAAAIAADDVSDGSRPLKRSCASEDGERLRDALPAGHVGLQARNGEIVVLSYEEVCRHLPLVGEMVSASSSTEGAIVPLPCIDTVEPLVFLTRHGWLTRREDDTPLGLLRRNFSFERDNRLGWFTAADIDFVTGIPMDVVQQATVLADYCDVKLHGLWNCLTSHCLDVLVIQIIAASLVSAPDASTSASTASDTASAAGFVPDWAKLASALETCLPRGWLLPEHLLRALANSSCWDREGRAGSDGTNDGSRFVLVDVLRTANVGCVRDGSPLAELLRHYTKWAAVDQHTADDLAAACGRGLLGRPSRVGLNPEVDPTRLFTALDAMRLSRISSDVDGDEFVAPLLCGLGGRHLASIAASVSRDFRETFKDLTMTMSEADLFDSQTSLFVTFPGLVYLSLDVAASSGGGRGDDDDDDDTVDGDDDGDDDDGDGVVEPSVVARFFGGGDGLQKLYLAWSAPFDETTLGAITASCPNLTAIHLSLDDIEENDDFGDEELAPALARLPHLASLEAYAFVQLGDNSLRALARGSPRLRHLDIRRSTVTDAGLRDFFAARDEDDDALDFLDLSLCRNITDEGRLEAARRTKQAKLTDYGPDVALALAHKNETVELLPSRSDGDVEHFLAGLAPSMKMKHLTVYYPSRCDFLLLLTTPALVSMVTNMSLKWAALTQESLQALQSASPIATSRLATIELSFNSEPAGAGAAPAAFYYAALVRSLFAIHPVLCSISVSRRSFKRAEWFCDSPPV